jgi:hypothetical protein
MPVTIDMINVTIERLFEKRALTRQEVISAMSAAVRAVRALDNTSTLAELQDAVQAALRLVEDVADWKYANMRAERAFIEARDGN